MFYLFALIAFINLVRSYPATDELFRTTEAVFVPGADVLRIQASNAPNLDYIVRSSAPLGLPGHALVTRASEGDRPPLFYIDSKGSFNIFINSTSIMSVNIVNTTKPEDTVMKPLQLTFSKKREGITSGTWSWIGTLLRYTLPNGQGNRGLFFQCRLPDGTRGVFLNLDEGAAPMGCNLVTLHSYAAVLRQDKNNINLSSS